MKASRLLECLGIYPTPMTSNASAWLIVALFVSLSCQGQQSSPEAEAERPTSPIVLNGTTLFRVRGVAAYPAEERAQAIARRIEAVAGDASLAVDTLRVTESGERSTISAGDRVLMVVIDADANFEGVNRAILAELHRVRIAQAINTYRREHSPGVLFQATLYALGATLVLAVGLFAGNRLFRHCHAATERYFRSKMDDVRGSSLQLVHTDSLWAYLSRVLRIVRAVSILMAGFAYAHFVLGLYPWTRPTAQHLFAILVGPLNRMGKAIVASLPNLLFLVILLVVVRCALKLIRHFFEAIENRTISFSGFDQDWAMPTYQLARVLVIAFALVVAYPYLPGSDTAAFKGVSVLLGVVFSFSSSSAIANVIGGYTLTYRRAYKVGDRVKIGDTVGDVIQIRLQATHVHSLKNEEVIVPNSEVLKTSVINYSSMAHKEGLILHTTVGIGYETPWRQVEAMLLESVQRTPGLLREPTPFVRQTLLGDFAITYEINAYCDQPQASNALYTALHHNILDIFNEYGVQIMTPAYVADPKKPKLVPLDEQFGHPAALARHVPG